MNLDKDLLVKASRIKRFATEDELNLYSYVTDRSKQIVDEIFDGIKNSPLDSGQMIFVAGPQNSGKSIVGCELYKKCSDLKRDGGVAAAQPDVDRSDVVSGLIYSRSGVACPAVSFKTKHDIETIFHDYGIVIVDEVHFVPYELQSFFLKEAEQYVVRGGWLINIGLLYTSLQTEFLLCSVLFSRSSKTYEMDATCQMCGRRGSVRNQRLVNGKTGDYRDVDLLPPSDTVSYEPRCEDCLVI